MDAATFTLFYENYANSEPQNSNCEVGMLVGVITNCDWYLAASVSVSRTFFLSSTTIFVFLFCDCLQISFLSWMNVKNGTNMQANVL